MALHNLLLVSVATIGFLSVIKTLISALKFIIWSIWCGFIRTPKRLSSYGSWAVVTGCTDGIGKAMALDLARAGLNLVLVGRNASKLEALTSEIFQSSTYGTNGGGGGGGYIETRSVVVDFAEMKAEEIRRRIKQGIEGLDVGLLVNNAGVAYPYPMYFHEVDSKLMGDILRVNIDGTTWVTEAVLPCLLNKNRGAIVNIGSGSASCVPCSPLVSVYAASKTYIEMFSKCLSLEYRKHGIDVQCQAIPLLVATKMISLKRLPCLIASPEEYSKASLRWTGYDRRNVPFFPHQLHVQLLKLIPDSFLTWLQFQFFLLAREKLQAKASMS